MIVLTEALGPLAGAAPDAVTRGAVILTRMSLLVFLMPGLGTRAVPVRVKLMLSLGLTLALLPAVPPPTGAALVPLLAAEALTGAYLGFMLRVSIFALSIAGTVIAQALSLSQIFGAGISEDSSTTVSTLLTMAGATLFLTAGLHIEGYALLLHSYDAFPPGGTEGLSAFAAERALRAAAQGLAFGLSLALPFVVMNLAYNALLGVLNRAMPQMMVTFVGMPAVTFAGLALLTAAIGGLLTIWLGRTAALPLILP